MRRFPIAFTSKLSLVLSPRRTAVRKLCRREIHAQATVPTQPDSPCDHGRTCRRCQGCTDHGPRGGCIPVKCIVSTDRCFECGPTKPAERTYPVLQAADNVGTRPELTSGRLEHREVSPIILLVEEYQEMLAQVGFVWRTKGNPLYGSHGPEMA